MFPRGGGIWDQDPILMRDFRQIRKFERDWKEAEESINKASNDIGFADSSGNTAGGGGLGLEDTLNQYLEDSGLSDEAGF